MSTEKAKSTTLKKATTPTKAELLSKQIEKFHKMHELVTKRAKFQRVFDELVELKFDEQKEFFSTDYSSNIKWQLVKGRDIVFSISAPVILEDVQVFFMKKIEEQISGIDAQLLK